MGGGGLHSLLAGHYALLEKAEMSKDAEQCLECGSTKITESIKTQEFRYGSSDERVTLTATMPVFTCAECGYENFDERGEAARSAAIFAYLDQRKRDKS